MVVIVGAGITGAATAYYISRQSSTSSNLSSITIIDAVGPAACASGKAGAFVSSAWGDGTKRQALFQESFRLHKQLANELGIDSFETIPAFQVDLEEDYTATSPEASEGGGRVPFLAQNNISHRPILGPSAMVDPAELTNALFDAALERGANFQKGTVSGLEFSSDSPCRVASIEFEDGTSCELDESEDVVITLGPWTSRLEDWLEVPLPIDGILSTSIIWNDITSTTPETEDGLLQAALFCKEDSNGCHLEVFPRRAVDQSKLYVSGCGGSKVMSPEVFRGPNCPDPTVICPPNQSRVAAAQKSLAALGLSPDTTNRSPDTVQACIRPVTPDGMPIMGKLFENVYVATGGGPWGITWGPLMGLSIANMILEDDDDSSIRLASFKPQRFDTLMYRTLLKQRSQEIQ